jgi:hypothetical protein
MQRYVIELKKTIVIEIDASSEKEALEYCNGKNTFNDNWYYAEPVVDILYIHSDDAQ